MWNEIVSFFNGVFEKVEVQLRRVRLERERKDLFRMLFSSCHENLEILW